MRELYSAPGAALVSDRVLGPVGARFQAAAAGRPAPTGRAYREHVLRLSASPTLDHLLTSNEFFVRLRHTARHRPATSVDRWWSEHVATAAFGGVRLDGHAVWTTDGRTVGAFLEADLGTENLPRLWPSCPATPGRRSPAGPATRSVLAALARAGEQPAAPVAPGPVAGAGRHRCPGRRSTTRDGRPGCGQRREAHAGAGGRPATSSARVGEDNLLGAGVTRFARDAETHLAELAAELETSTYAPGPLTRIELMRDDGRVRSLHVPPVRDRIVERAILSVVSPVVDPLLGHSSYAYRPGLGVTDAVQALARLRDEGLGWAAPARRVLYAGVQGSHVRLSDGRLLVESGQDERLLDVPSGLLERLVCFGAVGVSAGVRSWALANGVDMVFLSRRGSYLGHAWGGGDRTRVHRLRAQLTTADDQARCLRFGAAVVEAKIRKQVVVLRRLVRRDNAEIVTESTGLMIRLLPMLPDAATRDELMGLEGAAARAYFAALGAIMPAGLGFEGRTRQPPLDVVNAALSYGYAILAGEAVSALCSAGLDPAIGLLHADADRRPSLALDLIEEFRPLIVDQVVTAAVKRSSLTTEHGRREDGVPGVRLTKAGRQIIIDEYEKRMLTTTRGALPDFSGTLRRHLYRQAERIAAFVHDPTGTWTGLSWR